MKRLILIPLLLFLCSCALKSVTINCSERVISNSLAYIRVHPETQAEDIFIYYGKVTGKNTYHVQAWVKGNGWLDGRGYETFLMPYHQTHFQPEVKYTLKQWINYKLRK